MFRLSDTRTQPRRQWENTAHYDPGTDSYTYTAMNGGQTDLLAVVVKVSVISGTVGFVRAMLSGLLQAVAHGEPTE